MPLTSRAAIMVEPNRPLVVDEVEVLDPGAGEVLIRLDAASLCHSDLSVMEGKFPHRVPVILGHEGIGEVVAAGAEVTSAAVGDIVIPYLVPDCGVCPFCRSGRTNMCAQMGRAYRPDYPTWFRWQGREVAGFNSLGTFSEYLVVPHDQVQTVNAAAPRAEASAIGCGVTTGLGAALIAAKIEAGSSVVVFGLGGVGLSTVQGARIAGATRIVAVDVVAAKEASARRMGATHFVDALRDDAVQVVRALTGIGADYAFDCAGSPRVFEQALACLSSGGWAKMISVGLIPDDLPVPVKWTQMLGRNWHFTMMGGAKRQDVARYVDWFVDGAIDLGDIVSQEVPLDAINEGFAAMKRGETSRTVIGYR